LAPTQHKVLVLPPRATHNFFDEKNDIVLPILSFLTDHILPNMDNESPLPLHPELSAVPPVAIQTEERGRGPLFSFSSISSALFEASLGVSASVGDGSRRVDGSTTNVQPNPTKEEEKSSEGEGVMIDE